MLIAISARVTAKLAIYMWNNAKRGGKFFLINLMNETIEIRATDAECDKCHEIIQVNRIARKETNLSNIPNLCRLTKSILYRDAM